MNAERSATTSMARAPRTMLKKRLIREIFITLSGYMASLFSVLRQPQFNSGVILTLDLLSDSEDI